MRHTVLLHAEDQLLLDRFLTDDVFELHGVNFQKSKGTLFSNIFSKKGCDERNMLLCHQLIYDFLDKFRIKAKYSEKMLSLQHQMKNKTP